jgi:ATP synthase protein I
MNKVRNNNKQWLAFIGISGQMGLTIFVFYKMGQWLESNYTLNRIDLEKTFTLLGVFLAIYTVISQVIHISNKNQ